jgi:hypothetical protein
VRTAVPRGSRVRWNMPATCSIARALRRLRAGWRIICAGSGSGRLDILGADERHTILREWNATARAVPRDHIYALRSAP